MPASLHSPSEGAHVALVLDAMVIHAARRALRRGLFRDLIARLTKVEIVMIYALLPITLALRLFLMKHGAGQTFLGYGSLLLSAGLGAALLFYAFRWTQYLAYSALMGEREFRALEGRFRAGRISLPARLSVDALEVGSGSGTAIHPWRHFDALYRGPDAWALVRHGKVVVPVAPSSLSSEAQAFILEKLFGRIR